MLKPEKVNWSMIIPTGLLDSMFQTVGALLEGNTFFAPFSVEKVQVGVDNMKEMSKVDMESVVLGIEANNHRVKCGKIQLQSNELVGATVKGFVCVRADESQMLVEEKGSEMYEMMWITSRLRKKVIMSEECVEIVQNGETKEEMNLKQSIEEKGMSL